MFSPEISKYLNFRHILYNSSVSQIDKTISSRRITEEKFPGEACLLRTSIFYQLQN